MLTTKKKITFTTSDGNEFDSMAKAQAHEIAITIINGDHSVGSNSETITLWSDLIVADLPRLLPILKMKARKVRTPKVKADKPAKAPKKPKAEPAAV